MNKKVDIVRAWKNEEYRSSLSSAQLAELPENPVGLIDLTDEKLEAVSGGAFAAAQTGTNDPVAKCFCILTQTADSGTGTCQCTCP